ncbi:ATP-dependent zinc protease [uncultured Schumannella sp.]|uniref:ATP-dependent zinc protease family protein n=1 Tax=uncultured Schumannella sp. TaxID=1195956 RepID=UPI0025E28222|nr:ATP-dependent zinc protease [uncultured Schumannella sp.]
MGESSHSNTLAGWREWIQMPEIGVPWIKAKLDTGAQTSAIHAFNIEPFDRDGAEWVRFHIHPWQRTNDDDVIVELPVQDRRRVRSSSGHVDERFVVEMPLVLVGRAVNVEVTLTNRDEMGFRMLIGRQALRHGFHVASDRSFIGGRAPKHTRRRNRGVAL